jgi:catechol 2,3-dioxygenase-like lactoylglutathione lyase family enzyme
MKAVRHLGIVVSDLDRALHFYQDLLGLKVSKRMDEEGGYLSLITGLENARVTTVKLAADDGNLVELLYFHSHPRRSPQAREFCEVGASHVSFTVDDIDADYLRLSNAGVEFNSPPQLSPDGYAKVAFCRDHDQTLVELVQAL